MPSIGQEFRDRVRCEALESLGYSVKTLDNKHLDTSMAHGKHCRTDFTCSRRMFKAMQSKWGSFQLDHVILDYFFSMDRLIDESNLHNTFNDRNLEWCKIDIPTISKTFKEKREERHIEVLSDKLNFIKNKIKEANDLAQKIREEQAANKRKKQQNIMRSIRAKK
jgi:hypothetical protein